MRAKILELFCERFPRYAFSIHEWTPGQFDEKPLPHLPLKQADILYLFGLDIPAALHLLPWLGEQKRRRAIFLEPDASRIASLLQHPEAKKILSQEQLEIYHLPKRKEKSELIRELSEKYPLEKTYIAYCHGSRRAFQHLQLRLLRKSGLTHARYLERLYSHVLLTNLNKNLVHLPKAFYANRLKNAFASLPAVICGAGPSLDSALPALRKLEGKALIFAGGSAISALSAHGIEPHFCVAIDPNPEEIRRLQNSFSKPIPLLFSTRLHPECLAAWKGPLGYLRTGMSGIAELWLEEELGLKDPPLGRNLSYEALSVTTLSAAIAAHFGCNPILLDGVDLAYTQERRYANGVSHDDKETASQPVDRILKTRDRHGNRVDSAVRWVMEASALSQFAKRTKRCRWIQCTAGGLPLKNFDAMPLSEVSFREPINLRERIDNAIASAPMPPSTAALLEEKTNEMRESLDRLLSHLDILIENKPGLSALAELDLKEELAYNILFFDVERTLRTALQGNDDRIAHWKAFREMAQNCKDAFVSTV